MVELPRNANPTRRPAHSKSSTDRQGYRRTKPDPQNLPPPNPIAFARPVRTIRSKASRVTFAISISHFRITHSKMKAITPHFVHRLPEEPSRSENSSLVFGIARFRGILTA
jgi:hypothetical protein